MLARLALLLSTLGLAGLLPTSASLAADPIMPLADVRAGMVCTSLSVVKGTEVSPFSVEIVDVVRGDALTPAPRLLVRVSGPAVDATGVGPGFSGSPIYCPDSAGTARNVGAISETIGEYGNKLVLATPIEQMLGHDPRPPKGARKASALLSSAKPIATPLTISGLSPSVRRLASGVAHKAGSRLLSAPSGPLTPPAPYKLVPGSAVAAAYSSGDVALGAIGTVSYRRGSALWAFGHGLDGVGARSLPLLDAYTCIWHTTASSATTS